ncbi:MAG: VanZ family protein [Ornithinimicrobium sp.]|uniref:VanZ family protein n=1 Tax=Ornithinimicrobium sp. TaxID=1977084 RepID=UPI001844B541|nr:VanZ family protein [Actinomycetota bacterium]
MLAGYLLGLAVLVLWPEGDTVTRGNLLVTRAFLRLGAPEWMSPEFWQLVNNVLVCVPAGALAMVLWPRSRGWWWVLLAGTLSLGVELVQWRYLPARTPSVLDVLANTTGAGLGVILGLHLRRIRTPRPRR